MHVLPNSECRPRARPLSFLPLIFFNQSVGSIACYVTRQVGTLNAINHHNQRYLGTSDPHQQIVIKMLWYQWGIVCNQSNVQIALLDFSLYYEWFNFDNPLLFSLHPTSLSKWKSQLIILRSSVMIQRSPSGRCWVTFHVWVAGRSPLGHRQVPRWRTVDLRSPACGVFFYQLQPKFPLVAERRLPSNQATSRPAGRWVSVTLAIIRQNLAVN